MTDNTRRVLSAAQLGLGLATLIRPRQVVAALTPDGSAMPDRRIVRVLGLRQVVQGAVGLATPTTTVTSWGAAVDASHAASLIPIVLFSSRYRAAASASAGLATVAAVIGAAVSAR